MCVCVCVLLLVFPIYFHTFHIYPVLYPSVIYYVALDYVFNMCRGFHSELFNKQR